VLSLYTNYCGRVLEIWSSGGYGAFILFVLVSILKLVKEN
jgi:hypothetical protein